MGKENSKKLNTPRNVLNILGIVSIALLYLSSILIVAIALVKPSYDDIFTNHKTGIWYGFSQILKNTNSNTTMLAESSFTKSSNLEWGLNAFGITVIALTSISLIYSLIVCILFKLNNFYFVGSKSLTVWNFGLPIMLVAYTFILAMLATPFNDGVWTLTITKNANDIKTSINATNGPVLDITNYFSLVIDNSKLMNGTSTSNGIKLVATTNLTYNGSLESNYASGSMSILLGAVLVYAIAIVFVTKLSTKLNKEFKGVVEQQEQANI